MSRDVITTSFVLHDLLGYKNVKLFDGSMLEAAVDKSVPMETDGWGYKKPE